MTLIASFSIIFRTDGFEIDKFRIDKFSLMMLEISLVITSDPNLMLTKD